MFSRSFCSYVHPLHPPCFTDFTTSVIPSSLCLLVSPSFLFFFMLRRPPRSTRTDTLFPYTTLFRSLSWPARPLTRAGRGRQNQPGPGPCRYLDHKPRSEEHTSELQPLMRISYAVFRLKQKKRRTHDHRTGGRGSADQEEGRTNEHETKQAPPQRINRNGGK